MLQTEAYLLLDLCTESLVDRLAASHEDRLPEPAALAAFAAVCEAVAVMHAQQPPIAHRLAFRASHDAHCAANASE